nr:caffeoylshikimate esterase-like [Ipomoea batatas]
MTGKALYLNALHRTATNQFWNLKGANNKRQKQSSVPEFFQENCSKIESVVVGPGGGAGIGCDINLVVDDCVAFFDSFHDSHMSLELPSFLYAKFLGGAITLLITLRHGDSTPKRLFDGVVLNGAMCGISDKFKPSWLLDFTILSY